MTSVQLFSGLNDKSSSRVLAPPGGRSNIFFGDAEPAPARAPRAAPAPAPAPMATSSYAPAHKPLSEVNHVTAPAAHGKRASNMHGSHTTSLDTGKHRDVHTSSRVLNPPGGKCHNIFG